jgi:protein involved in polysaccharide export with SLBB domain
MKTQKLKCREFLLLVFISFSSTFLTVHAQLPNPSLYTLRVGDDIDVTVEGYSEYSKRLVIRLDGFISYPLIGGIKAEGLTIPELEAKIGQGLAARLDQPRVFVTLVESKERFVYVWGAVKLSDRYAFESEQIYLLQALALAGAPDYGRAKLTDIQIWRRGNIHQTVDLTQLLQNAEQADVPLQPNDVVYVPNLLQQRPVMVTGAVLEQGLYEIEAPQIHPLQALMMAGGPRQDVADLKRAAIIRNTGERIPVNLEKPFQDGTVADVAMLGPGDTLFIPNAYKAEKVGIMGAVTNPGQYPIKEPVDMIEALALAGGWDGDKANLKKAQIIRANGQKQRVDLLQLLESGNPEAGPRLFPGDRLQVPNRLRINWSALLTVTSAATLIYSIFRR